MVKPTLSNPYENPPDMDPFNAGVFGRPVETVADPKPYREDYPNYSFSPYEQGVINRILGNLRFGWNRTATEYRGLPDQRAVYYEIDSPQLHMRNTGPEPPDVSIVHAGTPINTMALKGLGG